VSQERERGGPIFGEREEWRQFAHPEHFEDIVVDVAKNHLATILGTNPVEHDEPAQRSRPGIGDTIQVNHQVPAPAGGDVRLEMLSEVADRGRVESQAVPKLRDERPTLVADFDHRLEHGRPNNSTRGGREKVALENCQKSDSAAQAHHCGSMKKLPKSSARNHPNSARLLFPISADLLESTRLGT